jgi:hypothetical protein
MSGILGGLIGSFATALTNSYESIATVNVGSGGSSSISFSSIPDTFKHLQLRCLIKASGAVNPLIRFNGISTSSYYWHGLYGTGSAAGANTGGGYGSDLILAYSDTQWGAAISDILDYTNTNKNTTIRNFGGCDTNGGGQIALNSGFWNDTAKITSISITGTTFQQYSSFALYGIKG